MFNVILSTSNENDNQSETKKDNSKMKKIFHTQYGIGCAKYLVSYHDGIKKHSDESDFYDIAIFKNKKKLGEFIKGLINDGYSEKGNF